MIVCNEDGQITVGEILEAINNLENGMSDQDIVSLDTVSNDMIGYIPVNTNETAIVKGYRSIGDDGGGTFYYDEYMNRNTHNGGTIIDPTYGTVDEGTGYGCWIRIVNEIISVKEFGAYGDDTNDDTTFIQAAMNWSAENSKKLLIGDGDYKTTDNLTTSENLYMEWNNGAWIKPYEYSWAGAIITNIKEDDIAHAPHSNVTLINPQLDGANLPFETPDQSLNDNAIGFTWEASGITIEQGFIKNFKARFSSTGHGGKGINFERGVYKSTVDGTRFENCFVGMYVNGLEDDGGTYSRGTSEIRIDNISAENCGTAMAIGSNDSQIETTNNPLVNFVSVGSLVFHNCGYQLAKDEDVNGLTQKSGAVCLHGAHNLTIESITGFNDDDYAPYSTISDSESIGYGLTDGVGSVVWGYGNNIKIATIAYNGYADALIHFGMCLAIGEHNAPDHRVMNIDDFIISNATLYNDVLRIAEHDEHYPPNERSFNGLIVCTLGEDANGSIAFTNPDGAGMSRQYAMRMQMLNSKRYLIQGSIARAQTQIGDVNEVEMDIDKIWLDRFNGTVPDILIASDGVSDAIPYYGASGIITITSFGYKTGAIAHYRATYSSSSAIEIISTPMTVEANVGIPTGTTGTDGKVTIFNDYTNRNIYIENRQGSSDRFTLVFT